MKSIIVIGIFLILDSFSDKVAENVKINKIQVIGSHNSYKQAIDPALFNVFKSIDSVSASKLEYSHVGFEEQLNMGLRNLEIDVYADSKGGKYSKPKGLDYARDQAAFDPNGEMLKPGFKMFHVAELDFRSHALTLKSGLQQLRKWSESNPDHTPIFITLEAKDDSSKRKGFTQPEKFSRSIFDELDQEIINTLGASRVLVPDQVRGKYKTLEDAVTHDNWPTLKAAKGKFVFIFDAQGAKRSTYIEGHPSLKGLVMFSNSDPGTPEAAILIRNNSKSLEIPQLVKKGYIVRTRADSDTQQARTNDRTYFEAACSSGAQIITTDYYLKSKHFVSDYSVSFEDGKYVRLNPLFISTAK